MTYIIYDKTYEGPRYTYGLTFRPLMHGAQPKGYIADSERDHPNYRYGTVQYPRELSQEELYAYEMDRLPARLRSPGHRLAGGGPNMQQLPRAEEDLP